MKYKWLNKKENENLIIFFNGWGMDENIVKHLNYGNYDVIMFYDYNSLDIEIPDFTSYKTRYLISWSMGVMIATLFNFDLKSSTAVNGTLFPIHEKYGIHPKIYDLTIKGFNEKGRERFIKTIGADVEINRDLEEQKSELEAIKTYSANPDFKYNKVLISNNDKIISTKSQVEFWGIEPNLEGVHSPFNLFREWEELL